jgi:hypothetical protein
MKGVGDPGCEEIGRICRSHPRHVEIEFVEVDAQFRHHARDQTLAFGVVNELRLKFGKNRCSLFWRQVLLDLARVVRRECLREHGAAESDQLLACRCRRKDKDVSSVESVSPFRVGHRGVVKNRNVGH